MLCQFEKLLYPHSIRAADAGSYMVAVYRPCEKVLDSIGNIMTTIKAVGYCLPTADNVRYDMQGHWSKNSKHGVQFEVEGFNEIITPTKEGIIAYLSSGQIKGVGPKIAENIYQAFGNDTLEVLDKEPQRLLDISGISKTKLQKICDSYLTSRGARDVITFLTPHGITPNRAIKLYKEYGPDTMDIVKNHPYRLCEIAGIGFITADKIAMNMGFSKISTERVDEGLLYTLTDAETKGHLCLNKRTLVSECSKLLETPELTDDMLGNRALRLLDSGQIVIYNGYVYKARTAYTEAHLAKRITGQLKSAKPNKYGDLDAEVAGEESKLNVTLAPEQREAVKSALTHGVSIITGGPGTGKTMIQKAFLDIYHKNNPNAEICCCAPTGRAARRMEQSTGYPASTIHKALCLMAGEDGNYGEPEKLNADLVLVDEVSMLDLYLANHLFTSLKDGCQIVLVGDTDQLPSVGPGAVLSEMIACGQIPVVRLDKVFRQSTGSLIATNAKLIRHGTTTLEYGDDFKFIHSPDMAESADKITQLYLQEITKHGVDNVALLTPYRQRGETGVNSLNERLRDIVNPPSPTKNEVTYGKKLFRKGDKVMQIKNKEDVNNGDIGYITDIYTYAGETTVYINFGDGKHKEYDSSELDILDLGYASTIHKSQGDEYKSVILNLQCAHYIMLTRPLVYTAITRGKNSVTIIGEKRALGIAIGKTDTEKRGTCLAKRINELKN